MHRDNPPIEIWRHAVDDGRKNAIRLTASGRTLVGKLERHWLATFAAIASLEEEIGYPLRRVLEAAAKELEREGFSERVATAKAKARLRIGSICRLFIGKFAGLAFPERKLVDTGYATVELPFDELKTPPLKSVSNGSCRSFWVIYRRLVRRAQCKGGGDGKGTRGIRKRSLTGLGRPGHQTHRLLAHQHAHR